jgi:oligopeptide transport system substrate-binding protein
MFLAACSGSKTDGTSKKNTGSKEQLAADQTLNVLESAEIPTMDSVMSQDVLSGTMINATNEGLYRLDANQKVIPGVADGSPTADDTKTVYTIKLKKDTKWSNGDPVTAHDFVYAWQRAIDPKTASPYGPYFMEDKIKNATEIATKKLPPTELGIKATDDYTLQVTLVRPMPFFESYIAFQLFYPQNQKYVEAQGKQYGVDANHVLYNGPFKMSKWDGPTTDDWTLVKNDGYWNAKGVTLKTINFNVSKDPQASANAFEAGETDVTPKLTSQAIISQYDGSPNLERYLQASVWWLKMNEQNPALKNVNIRKAIATSIDRKALVDNVLANGSIEANFIVPKKFATLNGKDFRDGAPKYLDMDKKKAQDLWKQGLQEAGLKDVTLNFVTQDTESAKSEAAFIKNQLETNLPGLKLTLTTVPFAVRLDREDKQQYDLLESGWGPDYQDPMTWMDFWASTSEQQHMSYVDPQVDQLIKSAQTDLAAKPDERWKALQDAEKKILEDDAALVPLYQRAVNKLVNPKVKGFAHHDIGAEYDFLWTKIVKTK